MIFYKLIWRVLVFISIFGLLLVLVNYFCSKSVSDTIIFGLQVSLYIMGIITLLFLILTYGLQSLDYRMNESEKRLNYFYRPLNQFIQSVKDRDYKIEATDRDEIKKLIQSKYLGKKRTKELFNTVENMITQGVPIDKNNEAISDLICQVRSDIKYYEKRLEKDGEDFERLAKYD